MHRFPLFILTGLTSFVALASFSERQLQARVILDRLEASVNSSLILTSDVSKFREIVKLRSQLDPLFAGTPVAAKGSDAPTQEIVDFLIDERIISQQFPKTDGEVEQEINSIQATNHLDRAALKEALTREGFKFSDYFDLIRDSGSKRDLIDRDIRTKVSISDDDIKNYFYNHYARESSFSSRAFHLEIITISPKSYKTFAAANKVAIQALKDIKGGESFEEVAKRVSDDASSTSGGDLGVLTEDQMHPVIREHAKKLKIGEVSDVFTDSLSKRNYILKLVDVKSDDSERLNKMKEEIRNQLNAAEYQHQISLWLDRQRQTVSIHRAAP